MRLPRSPRGTTTTRRRSADAEGRSLNGIERLRRKRGDEQVTFADIADHLDDFVAREPGRGETVDALAMFLAGVEDAEHEHEGTGPTVDPSTPVG